MAVTQSDIARMLGVSQSTISHVLHGRGDRLRPETVKRIRKALREANYTPNQAASSLRRGHSDLIGVFTPNLRHAIFVKLLRTIYLLADKAGYRVILFNAENNPTLKQNFITEAVSYRVEGLIMLAHFPSPQESKVVMQNEFIDKLPMVDLYGYCEFNCPRVDIDRAGAMESLMDHLLDLGHRNIAFAAYGRDHASTRERLQGIHSACKRKGLPNPGDNDYFGPYSNFAHRSHAAGVEAAQLILRKRSQQENKDKYTAIVAMNDSVALGAIRCLVDNGIRVPEDMSVVGFDNLEESAVSVPRLTTVAQPLEQIAGIGFDILIKQMKTAERSKSQVLGMELLVRESTGLARWAPKGTEIIEKKEKVNRSRSLTGIG